MANYSTGCHYSKQFFDLSLKLLFTSRVFFVEKMNKLVFRLEKVLTRVSICVNMLVLGQIQARLEFMLYVGTILDYHYRASTRLRYQRFEICLEDKHRVGTPIRRYLGPICWAQINSLSPAFFLTFFHFLYFSLSLSLSLSGSDTLSFFLN